MSLSVFKVSYCMANKEFQTNKLQRGLTVVRLLEEIIRHIHFYTFTYQIRVANISAYNHKTQASPSLKVTCNLTRAYGCTKIHVWCPQCLIACSVEIVEWQWESER